MQKTIALALLLGGCVQTPIIATPSSCATLLPSAWRAPVEGADIPDGNTVGDWIAFGDAQTGKLDIANDRTISAIGIIERCEARDANAIKRKRFFGIF